MASTGAGVERLIEEFERVHGVRTARLLVVAAVIRTLHTTLHRAAALAELGRNDNDGGLILDVHWREALASLAGDGLVESLGLAPRGGMSSGEKCAKCGARTIN